MNNGFLPCFWNGPYRDSDSMREKRNSFGDGRVLPTKSKRPRIPVSQLTALSPFGIEIPLQKVLDLISVSVGHIAIADSGETTMELKYGNKKFSVKARDVYNWAKNRARFVRLKPKQLLPSR